VLGGSRLGGVKQDGKKGKEGEKGRCQLSLLLDREEEKKRKKKEGPFFSLTKDARRGKKKGKKGKKRGKLLLSPSKKKGNPTALPFREETMRVTGKEDSSLGEGKEEVQSQEKRSK